MSRNIVKNIFKHSALVARHKYWVFKLSLRLGIPFRGLIHDLSKYSITEFAESIKYYTGKKSPISLAKEENGYSKAWLHHKGRNKHHIEYWLDLTSKDVAPVIPYKYVAEMVCDKLAASIVYNGKNWTNSSEFEYWEKEKTKTIINPKNERFFTEVFKQVKENGIEKTITKQNIQKLYEEICINDKRKYKYEFHGEWKEV